MINYTECIQVWNDRFLFTKKQTKQNKMVLGLKCLRIIKTQRKAVFFSNYIPVAQTLDYGAIATPVSWVRHRML